ncbi:MAG: hypothetical protein HY822_15605 [Acidobacteria bacterium]|nr:hypothetical protein [Acidobacteriota bacterium]
MNLNLLAFCFRSLYREYGSAFVLRVILAHPVATVRGIARYARGGTSAPAPWQGGEGSLVGIGFCLKPVTPACPAGRPNHRCQVFEVGFGEHPAPCRDCLVRAIGRQALAAGSAVYVMTSARDVLRDVLLPTLRRRRFRGAVLTLCRYSFEPMRLALAICGIEARLVPFMHGDCRDYPAWRRADTGHKPEQTLLGETGLADLTGTLSAAAQDTPARRFQRAGNIYEPRRV